MVSDIIYVLPEFSLLCACIFIRGQSDCHNGHYKHSNPDDDIDGPRCGIHRLLPLRLVDAGEHGSGPPAVRQCRISEGMSREILGR